jgi:di/tricarboxylate transporter
MFIMKMSCRGFKKAKRYTLINSSSKISFILIFLISIGIFFSPPPEGIGPQVMKGAAVIILAIGLWSTAIIPPSFGALIFLFIAVILSIAPAKVVFSGFHSGATWLVFGGLIFGLGVKKTGLDTRLVRSLLIHFPQAYIAMIYGVFWIGTALAFIIPSASGRVAVLVPIMAALAKELGFSTDTTSSGKGRTGLILAASMGTMVPAFNILPANVPNMALYGASDSVLNIQLTFTEYLFLNFPVMGFFPLLVYPAVIAIIFHDIPNFQEQKKINKPWSSDERRLLVILLIALALWVTDSFHNISPAWISLGAAIVCLLPRIGMLSPSVLGGEINYSPLLFLAGVIGLGAVANHIGLGALIGENILRILDLQKGADFYNYASISITGMIIGLFTTMPAQPPIMVAMAPVLAEATGWSQMSVIMTAITAWGVFPFFYQAPPVVVAVTLGNLRILDVTKMLVLYMLIGILLKLPLHFVWGQFVGKFTAVN